MNHPPRPDSLKPGSLIGITCPAAFVPEEKIQFACSYLESRGYRTLVSGHYQRQLDYFAGTDEERLEHLQFLMDHEEVDAILMGRGGYGTSRIIDRVDFTRFRKNPKWICGFSDIGVLHGHILAQWGIPVIHSIMCNGYQPEVLDTPWMDSFFRALNGEDQDYHVPAHPDNQFGEAESPLVGGNLAIFTHLIGTPSAVDTEGKILFLEDVGECLYKIDRMMYQLRRSGALNNLAGLLFGDFTDTEDTVVPFGQSLEEILKAHIPDLRIPVGFGFPSGHEMINYSLVLGETHHLKVNDTGIHLHRKGRRSGATLSA